MERFGSIALLSLLSTLALGCAIVASPVGNGAAYTQVRGPITTGAETGPTKSGKACAANYLGFVAIGDASIDAAKKNAGVSSISTVDHSSFGVLGFYSSFCTIITGR